MCKYELRVRQGFPKLSSDIQTDRNRHTDTTKIIHHAPSRVVNKDDERETLKHNRLIHLVSESTLDGVTERASRDAAAAAAGR